MSKTLGSIWTLWDLHNHTDASDGKMTCEQLLDEAKVKGVKCIAITDHHTAKNVDEAKRLGKEKRIHVIAGIEFRTEYGQKSVHIIGLFPEKHGDTVLDSKSISIMQNALTPKELNNKLDDVLEAFNDFKTGVLS